MKKFDPKEEGWQKAIFSSEPVKIVDSNNGIFGEGLNFAAASINDLKRYLPNNLVDLDKNWDLIPVAFNAYVANRANKNGHIVGTKQAISAAANFIFKPFDIEHNRNHIVGFCTNYGFSEFGTDKPLSYDEVKDMKEPFNIVMGGFVWEDVSDDFVRELEESSDSTSNKYNSISASWEIYFRNFNIARGSKDLMDCEIISEKDDIVKLKDSLSHYKGSGRDDKGNAIYLNTLDPIFPIGIGFTNNPAAEVSGVLVGPLEEANANHFCQNVCVCGNLVSQQRCMCKTKTVLTLDSCEKCMDQQNNSQDTNFIVTQDIDIDTDNNTQTQNNDIMDKDLILASISELNEETIEKVTASHVSDLIQKALEEAADKYGKELTDKESAIAAAQKAVSEQNVLVESYASEIKELKEQNEKFGTELEELKANFLAEKVQADFDLRMACLDEGYNLSDKQKEIVGKDIHGLDEAGYASYVSRFEILFESAAKKAPFPFGKDKKDDEEGKEGEDKEKKEKEKAKASEDIETAVASAAVEEPVVPNIAAPAENLWDKMTKAFASGSVTVTNNINKKAANFNK